jgi:hypothetical protein
LLTWCVRDGPRRSHRLRYVLRNRSTSDTYLVILITIHHKDNVNEDGTLKDTPPPTPGSSSSGTDDESDDSHDEQAALEEARKHLGPTHAERAKVETSIDDVD